MLEEFADRIQNAKDKQFMLMERFHVGDTVYPFWLKNFIVYGTVIDIDTVARKIICDFNGVMRQFCPEDLMLVNPNLVQSNNGKSKKASKEETQLSPDTDNGINAICKECKGEIAVSYNEKEGKTDFVCTECGKRIPENKLSEKTKKAMRRVAFKNAELENSDNDKLASELIAIAKMLIKGE
jgi:site-specific DNA-adenine methylase